jgi:teichuronic acid biosynthesis glycosyltransferase TuaG
MIENIPLVTIIIPTNRRIQYLQQSIESIIEQSYSNFELLVISDGKDTATRDTVAKFQSDKRISYFECSKTSLPAAIRNFGITQAKGDYIAFCDDDDMWEKDKLEKQMNLFSNTNAQVCFTLSEKINAQGAVIQLKLYKKLRFFIDGIFHKFDFYLLFSNFVTLSSLVVKKEIIQNFNEETQLRGSEDYDFSLRLCKGSKVYFLKEKLVRYRIHNENLSGNTCLAYKRAIKILNQKILIKEYGFFTTTLAGLTYKLRLLFACLSKQKSAL